MAAICPHEQSIFEIARKIESREARDAYLQQVCGDDAAIAERVRTLLAAHDQNASFLEAPAADRAYTLDSAAFTERIGSQIGPYKLMEQIGEGGMGLVFVAEQHHPIRRKVALKLIKPGMDTRHVIARFEAERQALALMNHPNIARVFDGGETPSGRPYFVMEFVKGVPITEYCDQNRLTPRARLELFRQVCAAVQHAHQKGVIHRDIKPSNVIVSSHDGTPVVKVIDFGVAKAIGQQLTDKTIYTQVVQFIGTPLYMSPEQAGQSDLDIDTRSDVYALGVLLYELLTGTTPFDKDRLKDASYDEIRRIIREDEPPKPSTRMSTLNAQAGSTLSAERQSNPRQLSLMLRGELDWIVMKALEKDRNRRYESANALAADIERYLKDEPVLACSPSRRYLLGKFLRRHRTGVFTSVAAAAAALLVAFGAGWVTLDQATRRSATEQAVAEDLKQADGNLQQEQWADARQALERAKGHLAGSGLDALQSQVELRHRDLDLVVKLEEARMKAIPVSSDFNRDIHDLASDRAYAAAFAELDLDVTALPPEDVASRIRGSRIRSQLVEALDHWAFVKGRLPNADAKPLRRIAQLVDDNAWRRRLRDLNVIKDPKALERMANEEGILDQPPASLLILSSQLNAENSSEAALSLLRRAQRRYPADFRINFDLGMMLVSGATSSDRKTRAREAVRYFQAALAQQPRNPHVYIHLADAVGTQGLDYEREGQALVQKAIELRPDFAEAYFFLGNGLWTEKKLPEAERAFRKVIEFEPENIRAHGRLVDMLFEQGKISTQDAIAQREQLLDKAKVVPIDHWTHQIEFNLGVAYFAMGQDQKAVALFDRMFEESKIRWGPDHHLTLARMVNLGVAHRRAGDFQKAIPLLTQALSKRKAARRAFDDAETLDGMEALARTYFSTGDFQKAIPLIERILETKKAKLALDDPTTLQNMANLAKAYEKAGKLDLAERILQELLDLERAVKKNAPNSNRTINHNTLATLGNVLLLQHKYREAEPILHECLSIRVENLPDHWLRFHAQFLLGQALLGQKRYSEAERQLREGYDGVTARAGPIASPERGIREAEVESALTRLYEAWGKKEEAVRWHSGVASGFIRAWLVLSDAFPYESGDFAKVLDQQKIPGEGRIRPRAGESIQVGDQNLVWKELRGADKYVDLKAEYSTDDRRIAYMICYLHADEDVSALLSVAQDDMAKVYLNGKEVYRALEYRELTLETTPIALKKGSNALVVKVINGGGSWGGIVRVWRTDGQPTKGIEFRLTP